MSADKVDTVVVGAGVVGLAVARAIALRGREVMVLEAEGAFGTHASSRNSEVIHAGIYYPRGSLKARMCVAGRKLLYSYCEERAIPHRRVGKLLVAVEEAELETLDRYCALARTNGVADIERLQPQQWQEMEPEIRAVGAAWSPSTGIIDSHQYMLSLLSDIERNGGQLVCNAEVLAGSRERDRLRLEVGGAAEALLSCRRVINCAGLRAPAVARALGVAQDKAPVAFFARGCYYSLVGRSPFRHLVYPMPNVVGLGVHVTLDLQGGARFGPDVQWIDGIDYRFEENCESAFRAAIGRYYPAISGREIMPAYCGIRARIAGPEDGAADFVIAGPATLGVPGLICLFGIESPGLTSSLALAEWVASSAEGL